jgi:hypothetical protein
MKIALVIMLFGRVISQSMGEVAPDINTDEATTMLETFTVASQTTMSATSRTTTTTTTTTASRTRSLYKSPSPTDPPNASPKNSPSAILALLSVVLGMAIL